MAVKAQRTTALISARQLGKCGEHVSNIESEKERKHTPEDFDGSETPNSVDGGGNGVAVV
jgi:hypothetical protein